MKKIEHLRAEMIERGDLVAHPPSGAVYKVKSVQTTNGRTQINYCKNHRGTLGFNINARRPITRWRNYG